VPVEHRAAGQGQDGVQGLQARLVGDHERVGGDLRGEQQNERRHEHDGAVVGEHDDTRAEHHEPW
jgi:hypothetical protein